jgi:hypothetical protein
LYSLRDEFYTVYFNLGAWHCRISTNSPE